MINLNQLRAFYYVAKYSSYTLAAEKLFISQPAVTAQVKLFENYYDLKLFKRCGKNSVLTHTGELIYKKAAMIFEQEADIEQILENIAELKQGVLELGCTKAYASAIMPSILSSFHRSYPNIKIILKEGTSMKMIESLVKGENEVIVVAQMQAHEDKIEFIPFSQEEIVVVLPVGHPLTQKRHLEFNDIAREPLIMKGQGSGTSRKILELFDRYNVVPNVCMESSNTGFILELVERGEGISFLVKPSVEKKISENKITFRYLKNMSIHLDVSLGYMKHSPLSPAANAFYEVVKNSYIKETPKGGIGSLMARILANHPRNE